MPLQFSSEQPEFWSFSLAKLKASDKENLGITELEGFSISNQEKKISQCEFFLKSVCMNELEMFNLSQIYL